MGRSVPSHLAAAGIVGKPLTYTWDESSKPDLSDESPRLQKLIGPISRRGILVLSAGFAQWIAFLLSSHADDATLFDVIDAARAAAIDLAYVDMKKRNPDKVLATADAKGQVRAPLIAGARILGGGIRQLSLKEAGAPRAADLANLAEYVVPDKKVFKSWRDWAIERMLELEPRSKEAPDGNPVPIAALDPGAKYDPNQAKKLLGDFLKGLDPKKNPFLRPAAELKAAGLHGKPYEL